MIINNYHTHSNLCDGLGEIEDYVLSAIKLGCSEIGFSGHSHAPWDKTCLGMDKEKLEKYKEQIELVRQKYRDIKIYRGIELDYYSEIDTKDFDYIIGAVHYVKKGEEYIPVDYKVDILIECVNKYYKGDFNEFVADYYNLVADLYDKTKCGIIAHIDLITKLNKNERLFSQSGAIYQKTVINCLEKLDNAPVLYEVNTGGMARGYTSSFYPQDFILDYLGKKGKTFILSSDCHNSDMLLYKLKESKAVLDNKGYKVAKDISSILKA